MKHKKSLICTSFILVCALLASQFAVYAAQGSYTHGSSTTVTEDELFTSDDIPSDYNVNTNTQGSAKSGDYTKLFDNENVDNVYIDIDENNWNYMLQNAIDKPNVLTNSITIGGESVAYAGIKTKGNLTLSSVCNSDSDRFSFTVNFGKYIKKSNGYSANQNFYGLRKVAFNDIYGDASLMKEYLSYELMKSMGVATPCYSLVNLYVNGKIWGVYMMVESVDSALTQRTLGEKSDFLVKPESSGGDLVYNDAMDKYLNENGEFEFTSKDYPTDTSDPLYAYNGLWENGKDTFADIVDTLPTVFKWMKTLNELSNSDNANTDDYVAQLSSICNVDELLRYFAANTYLVNLDSYQSDKMQNYGMYMNDSGYMSIIPWDYNFSFGGYGVGNAESMVNFSISNPVLNTTLSQRPLLNVLLKNDKLKAKFNTYLKDCCIIASKGGTTSDSATYAQGNFDTIIEKYAEILKTDYANDPTAFYTTTRQQQAISALKELNNQRATAVMQQLNGNTETVTTDVNLSTIGDSVGGGNGGDQPGGNQQNTLTDSTTKISVTGMFSPDSTLTVNSLTNGSDYEKAVSALGSNTIKSLYNISINMGSNSNVPSGSVPSGSVPSGSVPSGSVPSGSVPSGSVPSGSVPSGSVPSQQGGRSYSVSIPVSDSTLCVYYISQDGTATKMKAQSKDGYAVFTTENVGLFAVVSTSDTALLGDSDLNGSITIDDVTAIQKYLAKKGSLNSEQLKASDVDGSNIVDIADATYIAKYLAKKDHGNFKIGEKIS